MTTTVTSSNVAASGYYAEQPPWRFGVLWYSGAKLNLAKPIKIALRLCRYGPKYPQTTPRNERSQIMPIASAPIYLQGFGLRREISQIGGAAKAMIVQCPQSRRDPPKRLSYTRRF